MTSVWGKNNHYRLARAPACEAMDLAERYDAGEDLSHTLSPEELARLSELKFPKRRRDWLAGRLAAKRLIVELLFEQGREIGPGEIAVLNRKDGSPYVVFAAGDGAPPISLSHAPGGAVAASVAAGSLIGVDAESVMERSESFVSVFAHPSERPGLGTPQAQTRLWTLKEAVLKLLGLGLSVDLWDVRFLARPDPEQAAHCAANTFPTGPQCTLDPRCPPLGVLYSLELCGRALSRWNSLGCPEIRFESSISGHEAVSVAYTGG